MKVPKTAQSKSEQLVEEMKRRQRAREIVDVEEERVKVVIFTCGIKRYAFYGVDIREILSACELSWIPSLPPFIPGLINVRGDIESAIDIRHFLGEEANQTGKSLIAMAVRNEFRAGVMIDAVEDVTDIPVSDVAPPLATLGGPARELVCGEIVRDGETIALLDIGKLAALITL